MALSQRSPQNLSLLDPLLIASQAPRVWVPSRQGLFFPTLLVPFPHIPGKPGPPFLILLGLHTCV